MIAKRRYRLLCPIAQALDVVGDRWALLIVRDLQAGPARFQGLETGLGIATNLLSTRLTELTEAGLIEKSTDAKRAVYQLTELGRHTDRLLWELARFGSQIAGRIHWQTGRKTRRATSKSGSDPGLMLVPLAARYTNPDLVEDVRELARDATV